MTTVNPAEFTLASIETLLDDTVISMLNEASDHEAISNSVSIEVTKHVKGLKDELATKNQQIADLNKKYFELEMKYDALK